MQFYVNVKRLSIVTYGLFVFVFLIIVSASMMTTSFISEKLTFSSVSEVTQKLPLESIINGFNNQTNFFSMKNILLSASGVAFDNKESLLAKSIPGMEFYNYEATVPNDTVTTEPSLENGDVQQTEVPPETSADSSLNPTPVNKTNGDVVHLYFSHTSEAYGSGGDLHVTNVGGYIADGLIARGIGTSVDTTDVGGILKQKKEKYVKSYDESRVLVQEAMAQNQSLEYLIDVHRDSASKETTTNTFDGVDYAKVSFVIGGENPNYKANLQLAKELSDKMNTLVPDISNGINVKKGASTNGKFNQDLSGQAILIEVGGVDNTEEELKRTSDVFAEAFGEYYWQVETVSGEQAQTAK